MRSAAQIREHAHAVEQVREYMRRHRLSLADLTEMGGEDLRSTNPKRRRKALHVEKCWALMARLHVRHVDLESAFGREGDATEQCPRKLLKTLKICLLRFSHLHPMKSMT